VISKLGACHEGDKGKRPIKSLYDAVVTSNGRYAEPSIRGIVEWEATGNRKEAHAFHLGSGTLALPGQCTSRS
jgi:hypothetical protein